MVARALRPVMAALVMSAQPSHAFALGEEAPADPDNGRNGSAHGGDAREPLLLTNAVDDGYYTSGLATTEQLIGYHGPRVPVRTAYAASLVASEDTCMGSRTFGVQAFGWGVSFATTWQDRQCRRLKNARELRALGYPEAALQLLCMDDEVRAAMAAAGTPCDGVVRLVNVTPPPPPPAPEPPPIISIQDVLFDFDRSTLRPEASTILAPVLEMLRADPNLDIDIEGHTDWVGTDAYNQGLSERRARAVVEWFVANGVARERITSVGRGESEPLATNQTREGRQLNRRVEIRRQELPSVATSEEGSEGRRSRPD
jgi:outer membrane protein OmpA-like peptidoglycan-associated protein